MIPDDPAAPPPDSPPPGRDPARLRGAPDAGGVPRMEHVRLTAPDLARRAAMEKTRNRLVCTAAGFALLFGAVAAKLADATIIQPMRPRHIEQPVAVPPPDPADTPEAGLNPDNPSGGAGGDPSTANAAHARAMITDRNGEIMAVSLPTASVYADPRQIIDPAEAARKLKQAMPDLDEALIQKRLAESKAFVYIARQVDPRAQLAINDLGIPGIYFEPTEKRYYPLGRVAAQVLGGVDIDSNGIAGVEKYFNKRLMDDPSPLRLSIDVRVQAVLREELDAAMTEFTAIGACGIVMDVNTGEVIAMVSLPDYDANKAAEAPPTDRFNRAVTGMYEPGSTFKLQTAAMALDSGAAHIWDMFDASRPIHVGRFTITDFEGKHRWLYLPEVLAYSSNLGAAHIALAVGAERQRAWLKKMGMFSRIGIQLPEAGLPLYQPASRWGELTVMTVGFGHGIAVSPLHVVRGTAVLANGGHWIVPTILAVDPNDPPPPGPLIMQPSTSDTIRKLMRLVVTNGYGKPADVPGYFVGGKTGTAEKVGAHGYRKHANVSAFISVFPMNAPRYAVYFMLDDPHGNKSTGGFSTAGAVSAPAAGRVIARVAPMLGLLPQTQDEQAIEASLSIPLQPGHGVHLVTPVEEQHAERRRPDVRPRPASAHLDPARRALPRADAAPVEPAIGRAVEDLAAR